MADDSSLLVKFKSINCKPQGENSLGAAIGHNKRTQPPSPTRDIDASRSHLNLALFNLPITSSEVVALSKSMMEQAKFRPKRVDTIIAVEVLFSLQSNTSVSDLHLYFSDCAKWAEGRFKGRLLSADIHLDESNPHCHAIILLPLKTGGKSGTDLIGSLPEIRDHNEDFKAKVGSRYGLRMQSAKLTGDAKREAAMLVIRRLEEDDDGTSLRAAWPEIRKLIQSHPDSFLTKLGIPIPTRNTAWETFKQIALSAGKGPKTAAGEASRDRQLSNTLAGS